MLDDFDRQLLRARAGSGDAFTALYRDLVRPVAAYLRSRGVREVEDVTSDVFLAVFTGLGRFEGGQDDFRAWVFTIAHRRAVDTWRRTGRQPNLEPFDPEDDVRTSPSAESHAMHALGAERVEALLAVLTIEQREVLVLRIIADLTVEQVAEVVGRRAGAVKALQRRGLARVKEALLAEGVPL
ncbi:RNA polymerase sigma factor [Cellulomonas sp. KRMCY2]|uniref:RNA polymerase sigma factor n=1 Tax=Cellulomonas sp. KRMCY2 TaxID=1304865 RepID=UPI00045E8E38|nr:sigma-70 family RNA polymerase sigma factor [Cellulomonas sp. KRMCY2]